ncbi:MAG: DUF2157 domain-containing protein [Cyanobacteriota bacterium]
MAPQPDRTLRIEVTVKASQPELLEGLDVWLRLGLISDEQVKRLSQIYLTSLLPEPVSKPKPQNTPVPALSPPGSSNTPVGKPLRQSALSRMWQSLKDELSVRWLLFLGVFLVVVSSGVLAATQWEKFPVVGQYCVLWAYTLIFWFGSFWAGKQQNLQLTAQTLRLVTLLLVPVNFWAMDSFGLWRHPWEWLIVAIAAFTLTANAVLHPDMRSHPSRITSDSLLLLLLSYLHWGWNLPGFPLIAVYIGMVGTAILLPRERRKQEVETRRRRDAENSPPADTSIGSAIVIYALTVLLGRGIFITQLPIAQLGLAIGICGWLFARLSHPQGTTSKSDSFKSKVWELIGGGLLLSGWLVSVSETFPWQATAVSGLSLWFFANRLQRYSLRFDLLAIFTIGLQAHWLIWRLVPTTWQQGIVAFLVQLTDAENFPAALLSLVLFPYLMGMVGLTDWLYRESKPKLARFTEELTFVFGLVLTSTSLPNPIVRSLNLLLSTLTFAAVTFRWTPTRTGLVYLTHITGLLTLASAINWLFPNLNPTAWASILLIGMIAEWVYSILPNSQFPIPHSPIWQRSAWHLGFALSGLSYVLLWNEADPNRIIDTPINTESMLLWLLTPLALTGVASLTSEPRRKQASGLSVAGLGIAQALTILIPGVRLISLSFATGLMFINARYLRNIAAAVITIGFALSFIGTALWDGIPGVPRLLAADWFLVGAIAIFILWLLRSGLQQRNGTLAAFYAQACDGWAIALCSVELLLFTLHTLVVYAQPTSLFIHSPDWKYFIASCLIVVANCYRLWQQPKNWGIYYISWAVELGVAEAIILTKGSTLELATVNILLGLVMLFASDGWVAQQRRPIPLSSIELVPLLYALLGLGLRLGHFTPWTGLLTLGAALTGMGVGRRQEELKPLTYLAIAGISLAWYELVIYQMLQAKGGSLADAFTVLAGVAVAIAFVYRVLAWFWQARTDEPFFSLSAAEIKATAHIHWGIASLLMVMAGAIATSPNQAEFAPRLTIVAITLCLLLAGYALLQGRQNSNLSAANAWVYLGVAEAVATYVYARLFWTQLNVLDEWLAIIVCVLAYVMYELPWEELGWQPTAWKRSSLELPAIAVLATTMVVSDASLLLVAGFYAWVAQRGANIRWTYVSVVLIDWLVVNWFSDLRLKDLLWYITPFGLSLLYIAQFDPALNQPEERGMRHLLRIIASGFICGVALFLHLETGIVPAIVGILFIFAGLSFRVRAFLYVGTATFLTTAFYQLVILAFRYSFVKWVAGIILGIIFIGMAANFETRREQMNSAVRNLQNELKEWE